MLYGKKILGLVPARGGSKRVKGKNVRPMAGKPLLEWTLREAKRAKYLDRIVLSSEDAAIIRLAERIGLEVPFVRPAALSKDAVSGDRPVLHAIRQLPGYDYVLLLQPTSPLRTAADIDGCLEFALKRRAKVCVSVSRPTKNPAWQRRVGKSGAMRRAFSDGASDVHVLNGALFLAECRWYEKHKSFDSKEALAYVMPKERALDIDEESDVLFFEALKGRKGSRGKH
jgi:CMP-N,N'-diacetyllegionaminic acid synthase